MRASGQQTRLNKSERAVKMLERIVGDVRVQENLLKLYTSNQMSRIIKPTLKSRWATPMSHKQQFQDVNQRVTTVQELPKQIQEKRLLKSKKTSMASAVVHPPKSQTYNVAPQNQKIAIINMYSSTNPNNDFKTTKMKKRARRSRSRVAMNNFEKMLKQKEEVIIHSARNQEHLSDFLPPQVEDYQGGVTTPELSSERAPEKHLRYSRRPQSAQVRAAMNIYRVRNKLRQKYENCAQKKDFDWVSEQMLAAKKKEVEYLQENFTGFGKAQTINDNQGILQTTSVQSNCKKNVNFRKVTALEQIGDKQLKQLRNAILKRRKPDIAAAFK